jgi:hypothetical protein
MKKAYSFTELSDKVCDVPGCKTRLKKRLTYARFMRNIKKCYKHHVISENARGHIMKQA